MEEKRIDITEEENIQVEKLFMQFTGYCEILAYLSKAGSIETDKFDKKWAEAVELYHQLEKIKQALDEKYHPLDGNNYTSYRFDFDEAQMVYTI